MRVEEILEQGNDVDVIDRQKTTRSKDQTKPPSRYQVVLHNDPYTPAEYVSQLLSQHFGIPHDVAWKIMVDIHQQGKGIIATYPKDVAETKAHNATKAANADDHPLLFTAEKE